MRAELTASLARLSSEREYFARAAEIAIHRQHGALLRTVAAQPWQREQIERLERARTP